MISLNDSKFTRRQIDIDNLFISLRNLQQQLYYETKLRYFKKILSFTRRNDLDNPDTFLLAVNYSFRFLSLNDSEAIAEARKEEILNRLIKLSEHLVTNNDNEQYKTEFVILEQELQNYLHFFDRYLNHKKLHECSIYATKTADKLKLITKILRSVIKKSLLNFARDLRQSFRNIFNFLFKNLDDEADRKIMLNNVFLTDFFYLIKPSKNGNSRYNFSLKCNT